MSNRSPKRFTPERASAAEPFLPPLAGDYPFRLGIPSCVLPADILPNVRAFAPWVDNIELTLFESKKSSPPPAATVAGLIQSAREHDLSYTVHLPLDRKLGSKSATERKALQKHILAVMRRLRPVKPRAWILHLEGIVPPANSRQIKAWQERIAGLLPPIIAEAGDPNLICVENLLYPFEWCWELLDAFRLGVCIDVGHLLLTGADVSAHLKRFLPRTRVIHLHGMRGGKDHRALDAIAQEDLRRFLKATAAFDGVLTLELFNLPDVAASIKYLNQCLVRQRPGPTAAKKGRLDIMPDYS